ncbi:hypothetical protein Nm8I071_06180 [Nonomuraea sp. TT08I-71]|nr:hypothetical protein Nm8I071_06180 [Nonomuraea sp. TT08I-71]
MPDETQPKPAPPLRRDSPARPVVPGPIGPMIPPYGAPGRVTNVVPAARWQGRPRSAPISAHVANGPAWTCDQCGQPWPCPTVRSAPTTAERRATLIPEFTRITRRAIRDLRGRASGPTPPEIVKRFLYFLPLTDEEARAIALRLR